MYNRVIESEECEYRGGFGIHGSCLSSSELDSTLRRRRGFELPGLTSKLLELATQPCPPIPSAANVAVSMVVRSLPAYSVYREIQVLVLNTQHCLFDK